MERFNEMLQKYYALKKQHSPYDYREWRTGGELAKECKSILDQIAEHIKVVLIQKVGLNEGDFIVTSASGTGYYPKSPWIGIFKNGEYATDGIYPVLGFYNDSKGCFIGCVESFTNPQFAFQNEFCSNDGCSQEEKELLKKTGLDSDNHLARMPKVFGTSSEINEDCLIEALKTALGIYKKYREKYPKRSATVNVCQGNYDISTSTWYKEIEVDNVGKWLDFVSCGIRTKENTAWIFRGHGDARWHLVSYLERCYGSIGDNKTIHEIESNSIRRFIREAHAFSSYQRLNGVNILAMMQHYGSATRLLDFTYSPLIALLFAIDQNRALISNVESLLSHYRNNQSREDGANTYEDLRKEVSLAVWAVNLISILNEKGSDNLNAALVASTKEAHKIVLSSTSGIGSGVNVVLPKFGNERLSAQSGLFLMARDLGKSFEENLRATLSNRSEITKDDCRRENISSITNWSDAVSKFSVLKFVFPSVKVAEIKTMLKSLRITHKTIYPDLVGIAKDATEDI